ncbi:MAG: hypothetical protein ACE37N_18050, partial [Pseudohongiellaceae bacterium]
IFVQRCIATTEQQRQNFALRFGEQRITDGFGQNRMPLQEADKDTQFGYYSPLFGSLQVALPGRCKVDVVHDSS